MNKLVVNNTPLDDLKIIEQKPNNDDRGFLSRLYCKETLSDLMGQKIINQINRTLTIKKGTVRGLHFQHSPYAETKIISCLRGKIWDVAVDIRKGSPTFLKYHAEILSADNNKSYLIPEGFAHGFQTLTTNCEILYFHTENYNKDFEGSINAIDKMIGIDWPQKITECSERDRNHPMLKDDFRGIEL